MSKPKVLWSWGPGENKLSISGDIENEKTAMCLIDQLISTFNIDMNNKPQYETCEGTVTIK